MGDAELKSAGPDGVEIPREVVTALLVETLDKLTQVQNAKTAATGGHSVGVTRQASNNNLFLDLTLDFGAG